MLRVLHLVFEVALLRDARLRLEHIGLVPLPRHVLKFSLRNLILVRDDFWQFEFALSDGQEFAFRQHLLGLLWRSEADSFMVDCGDLTLRRGRHDGEGLLLVVPIHHDFSDRDATLTLHELLEYLKHGLGLFGTILSVRKARQSAFIVLQPSRELLVVHATTAQAQQDGLLDALCPITLVTFCMRTISEQVVLLLRMVKMRA